VSLQARASQWDHRLYNINRDVAHNFGDVMREVAARLEDERWPALKEVCDRYFVTQDDLGAACQAFCIFVASSTDVKRESMGACLARAGWDKVPEVAQIALMAIIGTVVSGYYFAGVREATIDGNGPTATYQDLRDAGSRCSRELAVKPWQRKLRRLQARWLKIKDALLGREPHAPGLPDLQPVATPPAVTKTVGVSPTDRQHENDSNQ
jgi:hypothetical protein